MSSAEPPLVSISCAAYNHEQYIAEALDSFLMQETSFRFEILVHDDASTDGTADIIRTYSDRYPDTVRPILQMENQFSRGVRPAPHINFPRAAGKYIAMCEADDFWTDPLKLQKQVDYLETHPQVFICGHAVTQVDADGNVLKESKFDIQEDQYFTQNEMAFGYVAYPTLSVMFRNLATIPAHSLLNGDSFMFSYFSNFGDAYISGAIMGAHRYHAAGVWSSLDEHKRYDALLETYALIPRFIRPERRSLAYLRYYFLATKDERLGRKLMNAPYALLMTFLWLRPNSVRFIARRLRRRFS